MDGLCFDGGESTYNELVKAGKINTSSAPLALQGREDFCKKVPETMNYASEVLTNCRSPFNLHDIILKLIESKFSQVFYCTTDITTGKYCDDVIGRPTLLYTPFEKPYSKWAPSVCASNCVADVDKALREYINARSEYSTKYNGLTLGNNYGITISLYSGEIYNPVSCCGSDDGTFGAENKCKPDTIPPNNPDTLNTTPTSVITNANDTNTINNNNGLTNYSNVPNNTPTTNLNSNITSNGTSLSAQVALLSIILCFIFTLFK